MVSQSGKLAYYSEVPILPVFYMIGQGSLTEGEGSVRWSPVTQYVWPPYSNWFGLTHFKLKI